MIDTVRHTPRRRRNDTTSTPPTEAALPTTGAATVDISSEQYTMRHWLWLILWWACLYLAIHNRSMAASGIFLAAFFIASTYKSLIKSMIIGVLCSIIAFIPFVNVIFMILGAVFMLMRIRFLIKNWRVLAVGVFAYGVHFTVFLWNSFHSLFDTVGNHVGRVKTFSAAAGMDQLHGTAVTVSDTAMYTSLAIATIFAICLHLLIRWLYQHDYSTERAFLIMGLSPLIILSTVMPFLSHFKVGGMDITGDSFLDAHSFSDASDTLTGVETGMMGAAAHTTDTLARQRANRQASAEERSASDAEAERVSTR